MNLQDLTLKQLKAVERVIYQDTYHFTDSDFFEYLCLMISESWGDDPEIRLFDDGTLLKIDGDLTHWFENELIARDL
jgi:hypothetical protein